VAYQDLLRALDEEVREQARALRESSRAEGEKLADEARRLASAAREEALARLTSENASRLERARVRASLTEERLLLAERRRLLEELRRDVLSRLPGLSTPALSIRLIDEVLADDDGSPLRLVVDPGQAAPCREHLAASRPDVTGRTEVLEAAEPRGGVELFVGNHLSVIDTLPSRLACAWPRLEVELSPLLFRGADGSE
jgi:vacuolar-type H+-ATPase subunit E/Vma4